MRRIILTLFVILALTAAGALLAQSTGTPPPTTGTTGSTGSSTGTAAATAAPDTTNSNPSNPPSSYGTGNGASGTGAAETGASGTTVTGGELPRTASELPLVAALGLLALGAGFIVGSGRKA